MHRAGCNLWIAVIALASVASAQELGCYTLSVGASPAKGGWQQAIDGAGKLQEEQKLPEARTLLLSALVEASRYLQDEYRLAYTLNNLGSVAQDQGQFLDAQKYYRCSLAHWERSGPRALPAMARTLNNLASLMQSCGKPQEARQLLLRSEQLGARKQNQDDPERAVLLLNLATTYLSQRNYTKAEALYQSAAAILQRRPQLHAWDVGRIARDLGLICQKTGRKNEAVSYYESAGKSWEDRLAAGSTAPEMYLDLASLYASRRQPAEALRTLETAISQWDLPDTPAKVGLLTIYAEVLRKSGRKVDAGRIEARIREANGVSQAGLLRKTVDVSELRPPPPSSKRRPCRLCR